MDIVFEYRCGHTFEHRVPAASAVHLAQEAHEQQCYACQLEMRMLHNETLAEYRQMLAEGMVEAQS